MSRSLQVAIPKGRMYDGISQLFADAGSPIQLSSRSYRARLPIPNVTCKVLKPQSIVEMLNAGRRDIGFAGADWIAELNADVVELLDTELNPVKIVAAAPSKLLVDGQLPKKPLVVASEYEQLTRTWMQLRGIEGTFVRSWGATEVLPPEDADCIVDNTATGSTLEANRLDIVDILMHSSTRLIASRHAMDSPELRNQIESLVLVLRSVLDARKRVMVELNVAAENLAAVIAIIPSMKNPTISPLQGDGGVAVKSAVPRAQLFELIPKLKAVGATDLVVSKIDQIVS